MAEERPPLLSHDELDVLAAMRAKILADPGYLRSHPLLYHLIDVELPRLIATARVGALAPRE